MKKEIGKWFMDVAKIKERTRNEWNDSNSYAFKCNGIGMLGIFPYFRPS